MKQLGSGSRMTGIHEMALGVATVLKSGAAPNPLPVDLWGYAPDDGADLLRCLADQCADAGIAVQEMRADPDDAGSSNPRN